MPNSDEILAPASAWMKILASSPPIRGRRGGMYYGLWVQASDEILAPASAGMNSGFEIRHSRALLYGAGRDVCIMASGCKIRMKFLLLIRPG